MGSGSSPRRAPAYMTEERRMLQEAARHFAMSEVLPVANRLDPVRGDIPREITQKMADLGDFGITIPQQYGGLGLGAFEYCLITEELARAWMSVASLIARGNGLFGMDSMTEAQRAMYLPKVATGEWLGAYALSEAGAGSDIANIACRARREGDEWVITGTKYWCTFADGADYILVFARTRERDPVRPHAGITAFIVEKRRGTLPGASAERRSPRSAISAGRPGSCLSTIAAYPQTR